MLFKEFHQTDLEVQIHTKGTQASLLAKRDFPSSSVSARGKVYGDGCTGREMRPVITGGGVCTRTEHNRDTVLPVGLDSHHTNRSSNAIIADSIIQISKHEMEKHMINLSKNKQTGKTKCQSIKHP